MFARLKSPWMAIPLLAAALATLSLGLSQAPQRGDAAEVSEGAAPTVWFDENLVYVEEPETSADPAVEDGAVFFIDETPELPQEGSFAPTVWFDENLNYVPEGEPEARASGWNDAEEMVLYSADTPEAALEEASPVEIPERGARRGGRIPQWFTQAWAERSDFDRWWND